MCQKCQNTGMIVFGPETWAGQESIKCGCKCCQDIKSKKIDIISKSQYRRIKIQLEEE